MTGRRRLLLISLFAAATLAGCGTATSVSTHSRRSMPPTLGALPPGARSIAGPHLVVPIDPVNVPGRYPQNVVIHFSVPIRNDGTEPLRIKVDPGCPCTVARLGSSQLAPAQQTDLEITFRTGFDGIGRHGEYVHLITNDRRATARANNGFPLGSGVFFYVTLKR